MAEKQLGIKLLGPTFYGTRQLGLSITKKINTPADLAGGKLRMPGGAAWQFPGSAPGATPTPMACAEVCTGLQTGAIDDQDNPLPNVENMKFYEVMKQIIMTSHLVAFDLPAVSGKSGRASQTRRKPGSGKPRITSMRPGWRKASPGKGSTSIPPISTPCAAMCRKPVSSPPWRKTGPGAWLSASPRCDPGGRAPPFRGARSGPAGGACLIKSLRPGLRAGLRMWWWRCCRPCASSFWCRSSRAIC
ncbi:TRAP transporter substrate-binding protein DctP [Falsigemmobacter faecalis]|uniref:TRAP transporter substrate-binding protein DctP n=1 Tax=Falsigemmobacter faecalis TaxID=2488730 RepID=UPI0018F3139A